MNREEFMQVARETAHRILEGKENGIMNLVQQAWAEGKRNAEVETMTELVKQAFDQVKQKDVTVSGSAEHGKKEEMTPFDVLDLISSSYYGKKMFYKQHDGMIFDRYKGEHITFEDAVGRMAMYLGNDGIGY